MVSKKPLLIYTHGAGRLGNQLFAYGHFVAFLEEHAGEFDFINLASAPYASLLEHTAHTSLCSYPTDHHQLHWLTSLTTTIEAQSTSGFLTDVQTKLLVNSSRLLHLYGQLSPYNQSILALDLYNWSLIAGQRRTHLDLSHPETVQSLRQHTISVLGGWGIRSWELFEKHSTAVRSALAIHPQFRVPAQQFVATLREKYDFLIGVVIRQGDYRTAGELYQRFLFESQQYVQWMRDALDVFAGKGRVGFIVASDEAQQPETFTGLPVHFATGRAVGPGHYVENLVELSLCDLIMTPATTFGSWAAFAGNCPILPLVDPSQTITPDGATPYLEAFKCFEALGTRL
jgi:hypothetical protein